MNVDRGRVGWGHGGLVALGVLSCVVAVVPARPVAAAVPAVCTIRGTAGPDLLSGTAGDDVICGLGGDDQLMGLGGNDALFGDGGNDVLVGGSGNDLLRGAGGNDTEFGGAGNDRLRNWAGADRLSGGPGNDHLRGGKGADVVQGGSGRDVASYAGHTAGVRASIGGGTNDGRPGEGDDIRADVENLRGGTGNDVLVGSTGANQLFGTAGNDRLTGLAGNDRLDGGGGRDVLNARDGARFVDDLRCGSGAGDRVMADMSDHVGTGCEDVVQNDPPTGISLSPARVAENRPVGTRVGSLSAADPDAGDRHTFRLVAGAGSGDNGSFRVDGTTLETDAVFDFEIKDRYSIRIRATDREGASFERSLTITIAGADEPPVAEDDMATVAEDAAPTAVDVLANDTDIDGGPKAIDTITQPANGTVVITGGGSGITYEPVPDYCNEPPGTTDTFTYTLDGGSVGSVSVTVTCVDDFPVAVDDTATIDEDAGATAINVFTNDTDIDAGPRLVDSVTQPENGTVLIGPVGSGLTYQPPAEYCNDLPGVDPDTFTYTLNGGSTATVMVTVTCVNDPADAVDDTAIVDEDADATTIDVLGNDIDPDKDARITAVTQPANGTVEFTGGGTGLTYEPNSNYCNDPPGTTPDAFTYTITGGAEADVRVSVTCVDDLPVAADDAASVAEDTGPTAIPVLTNDTDIDGGPITVGAITDPDYGTVVITGGGTGLTYQPDANYCNDPPGTTPDTFTYTLNGGDQADVSITVACVDDTPIAVDDTATVSEDAVAEAVPVLDNDTDPDGGTMSIDSVTQPTNGTVVITGGGSGLTYQPDANYCNDPPGTTPDTFSYTVNGGDDATVSVTVTCVDDPPVAVNDAATVGEDAMAPLVDLLANDTDIDGGPKTIQSATDPGNGTVTVTGGGTGLTYQPDANYCNEPPGTTPDTFSYTINGGSNATVAVTVTCVDDPPVAVDDTGTVLEDAGATAVNVLANDTDIDAGPKTISAVTQPGNGTVMVTGGGTGLTYQPSANYCNDPPSTTPDVFGYTLNGGSEASVAVTVTCVNDPPVGGDDSFTGGSAALGNTRLVVGTTSSGPHLAVAGSVLSNDTDPDTPSGLTVTTATTSSANCAGCNNVTLEADGNFIYDPPAGFTGNDTFTYTVNDNDPESPANQTDTATVTVQVVGPLVWYVDIDAATPAAQGGRSHSPFNSLAPLTTGGTTDGLDGDGDIIFVGVDTAPATGSYEGGIVLETNQRLWGEPFGLTVDPNGPRPATTLVAATPTTPATGNPTVRHVALGGAGIVLANDVDVQRVNAGITGLLNNTGIAGTAITTATVGPNLLIEGNPTGIALTGAAGGDISVAANITALGGSAVNVANRSSGSVTFSGSVTASGTNGGATLVNNTGATIAFTGPINLAGNGTAGATFTATGGGTITATHANNQVTGFTTNGINLANIGIGAAGITFNNVTSGPGGAANAIHVANVAGPGSFTVNGGAITATSRALSVDDNSANVTIGATLTTTGTLARAVEVMNRDGGTVDINGLVTETSQGIRLVGNGTGATIRFDGGITANTGTATAFTATGGGTIAVTDANGAAAPNNTLTSTSAAALNVANTTIGADDLTFQSISAGNNTAAADPANGIVLNNTGVAGNLVVSGDGDGNPDGGGGTIQNTTSHGLSLTNTLSPTLTDSSVTNAGDADNEYGLLLSNVSGTVTLDDMSFNNAADNLVYLASTSSSTVNVTGSTFAYPGTVSPTANSALLLEPGGAANLTASVTGSTFTNIFNASTQIGANTAAANGTLSLTFANNTVNSATGRAGGLVVSGQELTATSLTITNNTFTGAGGNGVISIDTNDTSTVTGSISNNVITNPPGIGIFSAVDEAATSTLTFNGNTITNAGGDGIQLVNFGSPTQPSLVSTMNATVTNNTVNGHSGNTAVSFVGGISVTGFEEVMDLQLTGNTVTGTPTSSTQCGGAPCVDYYLEEVGGTFRLEEIPDTAATTATAAYVNATNDAGPVTIFGVIDLSNGAEISSS